MPKLVCVKCQRELSPVRNEVFCVNPLGGFPYEVYMADKWGCPECKTEVIAGMGMNPVLRHDRLDFAKQFKKLKLTKELIYNYGR